MCHRFINDPREEDEGHSISITCCIDTQNKMNFHRIFVPEKVFAEGFHLGVRMQTEGKPLASKIIPEFQTEIMSTVFNL